MAPRPNNGEALFEDAQIAFRNFKGAEGRYNREGVRNFCIILDEGQAEAMAKDDWNIKRLKPREDDDSNAPGDPYIQVTVGYKVLPPRITMIGGTSGRRTNIDEESVAILDDVDIEKVDLFIRPYDWEVNDDKGRKAYLKSMYITIYEDYLDLKYGGDLEPATRSGRTEED